MLFQNSWFLQLHQLSHRNHSRLYSLEPIAKFIDPHLKNFLLGARNRCYYLQLNHLNFNLFLHYYFIDIYCLMKRGFYLILNLIELFILTNFAQIHFYCVLILSRFAQEFLLRQIVKFIFFGFQENLNFAVGLILELDQVQSTYFVEKLSYKGQLIIRNLVMLYSVKAQSFQFILFIGSFCNL